MSYEQFIRISSNMHIHVYIYMYHMLYFSSSERVKAMASRVGLGTPQEYTADAVEDEEEEAKSK